MRLISCHWQSWHLQLLWVLFSGVVGDRYPKYNREEWLNSLLHLFHLLINVVLFSHDHHSNCKTFFFSKILQPTLRWLLLPQSWLMNAHSFKMIMETKLQQLSQSTCSFCSQKLVWFAMSALPKHLTCSSC